MPDLQNMLEAGKNGFLVCPQCCSGVEFLDRAYNCERCGIEYPIICGIPDFRIESDRYLTMEQERTKALCLHEFSLNHTFTETVEEYYRITKDVPPDMALQFTDYVLRGEVRGSTVLESLPLTQNYQYNMLDAGCGSGGTVAAAARAGHNIVGIDIALRWLVIAQKRLSEEGLSGVLICANIETPPFPSRLFDRVYATDLFEHLPDPAAGANALHALLAPGGKAYMTGSNRFSLASYPPAGLWGVGFLPSGLRRRYLMWRRGLDTLRFLNLMSPMQFARILKKAGFSDVSLSPMTVSPDRGDTYSAPKKIALGLYRLLCKHPWSSKILRQLGPVFESTAQRSRRNH